MTKHPTFSEYEARLREFISRHEAGDSNFAFSHAEESSAQFDELALDLFRLQFEHVSAYRRFSQARGVTPGKAAGWADIPAIPTSAFKEYELTSLPIEERITVFHSSGTTTQQPSRHFHSRNSLALYEASLLPWFHRHILPEPKSSGARTALSAISEQPASDRADKAVRAPNGRFMKSMESLMHPFRAPRIGFVILTPPPALAPHSSLVHMFETARGEFASEASLFTGELDVAGCWTVNTSQTWSSLAKAANERQPVVVLGTAFTFVELLDRMAERNLRFDLPVGSRVLETGGYKGWSRSLPKGELHRLITNRLGIPSAQIVSEYGMSELSSQAYDCIAAADAAQLPHREGGPDARRFRFPPWARVQIVSPETGREVSVGETGLIRVFDLANVRSAMAIQTADLGVRHEDGFELAGRALHAEARGCSLLSTESR